MEFDEYQSTARETDLIPETEALTVPLLGIAGEIGSLLAEYKKKLRDGPAHSEFEAAMSEELGDILWYVANLATKFDLSLNDVARANLAKTRGRWGSVDSRAEATTSLFDADFPEEERFPRHFIAEIEELEADGNGTRVRLTVDGQQIGNDIADNAYVDDGYRFHDVFHIANVAYLGWSPTIRGLMHRKRKSAPLVDSVEDGGRAIVIDEGVVALIFEYARHHDFLQGVERLDYSLLRTIRGATSLLEVSSRTALEWERATLEGYAAWRRIRDEGGGVLEVDLEERRLTVR